MQADDVELDPEEREAAKAERMGLTPDWIIQARALFLTEPAQKGRPLHLNSLLHVTEHRLSNIFALKCCVGACMGRHLPSRCSSCHAPHRRSLSLRACWILAQTRWLRPTSPPSCCTTKRHEPRL